MKKKIIVTVVISIAAVLPGCPQRAETSQPEKQTESISLSSQETPRLSSTQDYADTVPYDSAVIVNSIKGIIQQYMNGTIDHESGAPGASASDFDRKPDGLEFPEIHSVSDLESIEPINGFEDTLIIKQKCSDDYVMQIWMDTA